MVKIYCIEDINELKYVGSTIQPITTRLCAHRCDKRNLNKRQCSAIKLNLDNCIIYELEECEKKDRYIRETYWINKIDCVNERNASFSREQHLEYKRGLNKYQRSWAIDSHYNNLLHIDLSVFL